MDTDAGNEQHQRKRARIYKACVECRRRRSRCDLVDESGCHRCKQLSTPCSFRTGLAALDVLRLPTTNELFSQDDGHRSQDLALGAPSPHGNGFRFQYDRAALTTALHRVVAHSSPEHSLPLVGAAGHSLVSTWEGWKGDSSDKVDEGGGYLAIPNLPVSSFETVPPPLMQTGTTSARPNLYPPREITASVSTSSSRPGKPDQEDSNAARDEAWYSGAADPETFALIARGIKGKGETGLRDPISEGVITEEQAQAAYQIFKHHFSSVFPHPRFLLIRSPLPTHPFLLSASLYYVARCVSHVALFTSPQIHRLAINLFDNINAFHAGCRPSMESILACFIVSFLAPGGGESESELPEIESARIIGLAYGQMRELGYSARIQRLVHSLETGIPIIYLIETIDHARIFLGVIRRHAWFSRIRCASESCSAADDPNHKRLLELLASRDSSCDLDQQLQHEYVHDCILRDYIARYQALESNEITGVSQLEARHRLVLDVRIKLSQMLETVKRQNASNSYICICIAYSAWWVTTRNVWSTYRLPSPLFNDAMYQAALQGLAIATIASHDMIKACLNDRWDLYTLPKSFGTAIVLCYLAASTDPLHTQYPIVDSMCSALFTDKFERLSAIYHILSKGDGTLGRMLNITQKSLSHLETQLSETDPTGSGGSYSIGVAVAGIGVGSRIGGELETDLGSCFQNLVPESDTTIGGAKTGLGLTYGLGESDALWDWPWPLLEAPHGVI